jgi:hypothetical protein
LDLILRAVSWTTPRRLLNPCFASTKSVSLEKIERPIAPRDGFWVAIEGNIASRLLSQVITVISVLKLARSWQADLLEAKIFFWRCPSPSLTSSPKIKPKPVCQNSQGASCIKWQAQARLLPFNIRRSECLYFTSNVKDLFAVIRAVQNPSPTVLWPEEIQKNRHRADTAQSTTSESTTLYSKIVTFSKTWYQKTILRSGNLISLNNTRIPLQNVQIIDKPITSPFVWCHQMVSAKRACVRLVGQYQRHFHISALEMSVRLLLID